jgi:hypothetical protein
MTPAASPTCRFCGQRAEIEVTRFDLLVPLGEPVPACRFCLGRPHRAKRAVEGAVTVRLEDLSTGQSASGRPDEIGALLAALVQQTSARTITGAIRVTASFQPVELVCAGCGGAVTPAKGGVVAWEELPDGLRTAARVLHGHACADDMGWPLRPGCWEDLDQLGSLDFTIFDEESMGYLTDVELAWKQARGT